MVGHVVTMIALALHAVVAHITIVTIVMVILVWKRLVQVLVHTYMDPHLYVIIMLVVFLRVHQ